MSSFCMLEEYKNSSSLGIAGVEIRIFYANFVILGWCRRIKPPVPTPNPILENAIEGDGGLYEGCFFRSHSYWMASNMRIRAARAAGREAATCETRNASTTAMRTRSNGNT